MSASAKMHAAHHREARSARNRYAHSDQPMRRPAHLGGRLTAAELLAGIHEVRRTLLEEAFYPPHAPRTESPAYARTHDQMVHKEDQACFICGVRYSTLHRRSHNPFGARAMETHHVHVEWALAGAVDLHKFNAQIVKQLRRERPHDPTYAKNFDEIQMREWIDHHRDNLLVLCDIHHRHAYVGIHAISGPIWCAQNLLEHQFISLERRLAK